MGLLYNRQYSVEVKNDSDSLIYENLRVVFNIEKTLGKTPDKATIEIYNLNQESDLFFYWDDDNAKAILKCGYEDIEPDIIFSGKVISYAREYKDVDIATVLTCGDGQDVLTKASINKSYKAGISTATIIDDIIKEVKNAGVQIAGDIKKKLENIKAENKKSDNGLSVSGLLSSTLETLLKPFNKTFTIQDDVLKIIEIGQETATTTPTLLTPETGLIGSPSKTKDGLEFMALIQPGKFNPGQFVEIKSRDFNGTYKIVKSNFTGDTHGNNWYVKGVCI